MRCVLPQTRRMLGFLELELQVVGELSIEVLGLNWVPWKSRKLLTSKP